MKGVHGKLLEVDLTHGTTRELPIPEEHFRRYLGAEAWGASALRHASAETDPMSPDNLLIFLTGPLTARWPLGRRVRRDNQVPVTHAWCDAYSSGRIAVQLKKAGYDGMVIRGRANIPAICGSTSGGDIRDAGHSGKDSFATEAALRRRMTTPPWGLLDRPAGEKLVKMPASTATSTGRPDERGWSRHGLQAAESHCDRGGHDAPLHDASRCSG